MQRHPNGLGSEKYVAVLKHGLNDSGARQVDDRGFVREPDYDKPDLSWIFTTRGIEMVPRELIERIAAHFANGALKYSADNWRLGTTPAALARYERSLARHIFAWYQGDTSEDHAAAIAASAKLAKGWPCVLAGDFNQSTPKLSSWIRATRKVDTLDKAGVQTIDAAYIKGAIKPGATTVVDPGKWSDHKWLGVTLTLS